MDEDNVTAGVVQSTFEAFGEQWFYWHFKISPGVVVVDMQHKFIFLKDENKLNSNYRDTTIVCLDNRI
jgi:hypothetical protein